MIINAEWLELHSVFWSSVEGQPGVGGEELTDCLVIIKTESVRMCLLNLKYNVDTIIVQQWSFKNRFIWVVFSFCSSFA